MHRGSRSQAHKRAQGTKRLSTIACPPDLLSLENGSAPEKVSDSMHCGPAQQDAQKQKDRSGAVYVHGSWLLIDMTSSDRTTEFLRSYEEALGIAARRRLDLAPR
jgi:hypothetical protein